MRARRYDTRLTGNCGAYRRNAMAVLGMLALAFNLIAGISLSARAIQIGSPVSELSLDSFVICTSAGKIVVDRDGNVVPDAGGAPQGHEPHCLFCLPLMQGSLLAFGATSVDTPPQRSFRNSVVVDADWRPSPFIVAANLPRGPPAA